MRRLPVFIAGVPLLLGACTREGATSLLVMLTVEPGLEADRLEILAMRPWAWRRRSNRVICPGCLSASGASLVHTGDGVGACLEKRTRQSACRDPSSPLD